MGDIVRLPYQVAPPKVVAKLVKSGYLKPERRHNADAVRNALEKLRSRPIDIFGRPEEDNEPTPAA
jgi:hypothetical protein